MCLSDVVFDVRAEPKGDFYHWYMLLLPYVFSIDIINSFPHKFTFYSSIAKGFFLFFIYTVRGKNFAVTSNALYSNLIEQIKLMVLLKPDKGVHLKFLGNLEIVGLLY